MKYDGIGWVSLGTGGSSATTSGNGNLNTSLYVYDGHPHVAYQDSSNNLSVMKLTALSPDAPLNLTAAAGDSRAVMTWSTVTEAILQSIPGTDVRISGLVSGSYGDGRHLYRHGLTNGTTYYYVVKAASSDGESGASNEASATPQTISGGPPPSVTPPVAAPAGGNVDIYVNGEVLHAGTETVKTTDDRTTVTVTADQDQVEERLAKEGRNAEVTIPIPAEPGAQTMIGEMNGQLFRSLIQNGATLQIKAEDALYTVPAREVGLDSIVSRFGGDVNMKDVRVSFEISGLSEDDERKAEESLDKNELNVALPARSFAVTVSYGNESVKVNRFGSYAKHAIAIPEETDPAKVTTGVIIREDGLLRHEPTRLIDFDGKRYVQVSSLASGIFAVIDNPAAFRDVDGHWAELIADDMGSRTVMDGDGGLFRPERPLTRLEFVSAVVKGLGLLLSGDAGTSFPDTSDAGGDEVQTAYDYHLISGYEDGSFRPDDEMTRENAMLVIAHAMSITGLKAKLEQSDAAVLLSPFADAGSVSGWARTGIADCVQAAIINGESGTKLTPSATITKAETAALIHRLLEKSNLIQELDIR